MNAYEAEGLLGVCVFLVKVFFKCFYFKKNMICFATTKLWMSNVNFNGVFFYVN